MGKIFCIPYAGSSAAIYNHWNKEVEQGWEIIPVELSGRGSRFGESLYNNIEDTVEDIYKRIGNYLFENYIIYGHSMGALIAYELTKKIHQNHAPSPRHIIFSGCVPPNKFQLAGIDLNSDDQIKQKLLSLGGTSSQVIENPEHISVFLPILRADFHLLQQYVYQRKDHLLTEDISVFYGKNDNNVSIKDVRKWDVMTSGKTYYHTFEGDHFFLNSKTNEVMDCIRQICRNVLK
ncbi:thioesterase II family protein [Heyndrickxia sporothermodurans]|uniref:thioesterase II family protein n=1 Tax=Heyndrickxia sporothermodurans TaxID=46224 RepID=UPI0035E064E5